MVDPMDALPPKVNTIEQKLDALIGSVDQRFRSVDQRFDAVDQRFASVDERFDKVTSALVEQRRYTEFASERLRGEMAAGFAAMTTNFGRLERKLDQLIDRIIGKLPNI